MDSSSKLVYVIEMMFYPYHTAFDLAGNVSNKSPTCCGLTTKSPVLDKSEVGGDTKKYPDTTYTLSISLSVNTIKVGV